MSGESDKKNIIISTDHELVKELVMVMYRIIESSFRADAVYPYFFDFFAEEFKDRITLRFLKEKCSFMEYNKNKALIFILVELSNKQVSKLF
jgi:hypothetical protein